MQTLNDRLNKVSRKDTYNAEYAHDAGEFQTYAIKGMQYRNPYSDIRSNPKYWVIGAIERAIGNGLMTLDYAKLLFDRCMVDDKSALIEVWHLR